MQRTVVLNVVGLTRALLGQHTPHLQGLATGSANIQAITPAVTCTMQSTYLTGKLPAAHGIVGNGWYFRDLAEVFFWRQSNRLVQAEKIWQVGKRRDPMFTCANNFWWYNMATDVDWAVTPRPVYCADGRKLPDCYTIPAAWRDKFNRELGTFPLFQFWGPATSIVSSQWITQAAMAIERMVRPTLNLIYLPHLDYILQKSRQPDAIARSLAEIDAVCGELLGFFRERGCRVVVLSEYGITPVSQVVHPNRILRHAGYLAIKSDLGREYLDPGASRALAVADHQIAHLYIRNRAEIPAVYELFQNVPGIECIWGEAEKRAHGLDHERAGELVLIAKSDAWFTYYFWNDDALAPDYAKTVNIHAKPGYDPCELLLDPAIPFPKLKIAWALLKKRLGFRYLLEVIPLDASLVKGSHGRVTDHGDQGPIFMTTEPKLLHAPSIRATEVFSLLLEHIFGD